MCFVSCRWRKPDICTLSQSEVEEVVQETRIGFDRLESVIESATLIMKTAICSPDEYADSQAIPSACSSHDDDQIALAQT